MIPEPGDTFNARLEYYEDENGEYHLFMPNQKGYLKVVKGCPCVCTKVTGAWVLATDKDNEKRIFCLNSPVLSRIVTFEILQPPQDCRYK